MIVFVNSIEVPLLEIDMKSAPDTMKLEKIIIDTDRNSINIFHIMDPLK